MLVVLLLVLSFAQTKYSSATQRVDIARPYTFIAVFYNIGGFVVIFAHFRAKTHKNSKILLFFCCKMV